MQNSKTIKKSLVKSMGICLLLGMCLLIQSSGVLAQSLQGETTLRPLVGDEKEKLNEAAAQIIIRETRKPDVGHVESIAYAFDAASKRDYDKAYEFLLEGLLGEDYVTNLETAKGVTKALIAYYGKNSDLGKKLVKIEKIIGKAKYKNTTDQTKMKKALNKAVDIEYTSSLIATKQIAKKRLREKLQEKGIEVSQFSENWNQSNPLPIDSKLVGNNEVNNALNEASSLLMEYTDFDVMYIAGVVESEMFLTEEAEALHSHFPSETKDMRGASEEERRYKIKKYPRIKVIPGGQKIANASILKPALNNKEGRKEIEQTINNNFKAPIERGEAFLALNDLFNSVEYVVIPGILMKSKDIAEFRGICNVASKMSGQLINTGKMSYVEKLTTDENISKALEVQKDYGDFKVVFNEKFETEDIEVSREVPTGEKVWDYSKATKWTGFDGIEEVDQTETVTTIEKVQVADNSYITISPLTHFSELKLTPVFFDEVDVVNNKEEFEKALEELKKNEGNIPVIVLNSETQATLAEKLSGIDLSGVQFKTQSELGLKDFDLASVKSAIDGFNNLQCIPITDALKTKYPPLAHATQG